MALTYRVLGAPGQDNAVFARITGRREHYRLLFDCGEGCPQQLDLRDLLGMDALCFSHLHMDHVAGFDAFFRVTYVRPTKPMEVFGPPETGRIMHHRLRGFLWNLYENDPGAWYVSDIDPARITRLRFETHEAFAVAHPAGERDQSGGVIERRDFRVEALLLNHHTPSAGYIVREAPRVNVDTAALERLGLPPGPWIEQVKYPAPGASSTVEVGGETRDVEALRRALVTQTPGDSLAYLTDFLLDEATMARLVPALRGVQTIICESQYLAADAELARRHHHLIAPQAAELARAMGAGELILFHVSDRYGPDGWRAMLAEARAIFPNTHFPAHWNIG
ncbi:MAG TPA: MBL fold metallo-hydrolase [Ktedonobacterales bacterium]|nr:MBL fold metallo-hydrolase [Ktedonobacterales bacterium]